MIFPNHIVTQGCVLVSITWVSHYCAYFTVSLLNRKHDQLKLKFITLIQENFKLADTEFLAAYS